MRHSSKLASIQCRSHTPPPIHAHTHTHTHMHTHTVGLAMETGLYNTLLQVYLLNEHKFVPSEIVEEMKESNVDPNQVCSHARTDGIWEGPSGDA